MKITKSSIIEKLVILAVILTQPGCSKNDDQSYSSTGFILSSPDIGRDSLLQKDYTCQGSSSSLCLTWKGIPAGTVTLALVMDHETSPGDIHCYWIIYDIPPDIDSLPRNATGIGIPGINSVNQKMQFTPPCSQGPGLREYVFTLFALSGKPTISVAPDSVNRSVILNAIRDITISRAKMTVYYVW